MIQDPQPVQRAVAGIAQRPIQPTSPAEPETVSAETGSPRFDEASSGLARQEKIRADDMVTAVTESGKAGEIARTQELRAELVRAETVLQISQEAFAAAEIIYAGMQELGELALNENLTEEERASLIAAFRELKLSIDGIVEATVFDGEQILEGGDGPDGTYVIRLSAIGESGVPLDILIPSLSAIVNLEGLDDTDLFTVGSERLVRDEPEKTTEIFRRQGDMIESQRATLQQIYAIEVDPIRNLSDDVDSFAPLENAERLSRLVSDIVLAGGAVPFEESGDRMRGVLERVNYDNQPRVAVTETAALQTRQRGFLSDPIGGGEKPQSAGSRSEDVGSALNYTRAFPGKSVNDTGASPDYRATADEGFQNYKGNHGDTTQAIDVQGEKNLSEGREKAEGDDLAFPIPSATVSSPVLVDGKISGPETVLAVMGNTDLGIKEIAQPLDIPGEQHTSVRQPVSADIPGDPSAEQVPDLHRGSEITLLPEISHTGESTIELPEDDFTKPFLAATQDLFQSRNQAGAELRQTELTRIGEFDAARRAPGLVQPSRESDPRLEAGLMIPKAGNDEPSDPVLAFGPSIPIDPGGFMAELVRADDMLHAADLSIEQIDLHLDYMRGLAQESVTESSRDRTALDKIFQVVKSDVIDTLALTTEAQGEKILAGGRGPDGEYVIRLSGGGVAGEGRDIAIPSMRVKDFSPELFYADVRTREAAIAAADHIEFASEDTVQARETISEQRTLIRQLLSLEITRNTSRSPIV